MAWTVTRYNTVFGDKRAVGLKIVADSATMNVETGLSVIEWYTLAPGSMTSALPKIYPNSGAGGTAIAGTLGISGFTSGDECYITVFGK